VRPYPNNNNDLADISLNRKRTDLSVDEENAIVSNELSSNNHSSVIEEEEISGEYNFEDNSIMF